MISMFLWFYGVVQAQSSGYDLSWWTVDSGSSVSIQAGGYSLNGTIGQADAGINQNAGNYQLSGGFWSGQAGETSKGVYLPLIIR
jgi:hypothetical protein